MKATILSSAIVLLASAFMTMSQPLPQLAESSPSVQEPHPVVPLDQPKEEPLAQALPATELLKSEAKPEESLLLAEPELKPKEPKAEDAESRPIEEPVVPAAAVPIEDTKEAPKAIIEPKDVVAIVAAESLAPEKLEEPIAIGNIARSVDPEASKIEEALPAQLAIAEEQKTTEIKDAKGLGEALAEVVNEAIHTADLISAAAAAGKPAEAASVSQEIPKSAKSDSLPLEKEEVAIIEAKLIPESEALKPEEPTLAVVDEIAPKIDEEKPKTEVKPEIIASETETRTVEEAVVEAKPEKEGTLILEEEAKPKEEEILKVEEEKKIEELKKEVLAVEVPKESIKLEELPEAQKLNEQPKKPDSDESSESSEESSEEVGSPSKEKNVVAKIGNESSQEQSDEEETDKKIS